MNTSTRIAIVDSAIRWTSNILVEVVSNHGQKIPPSAYNALRMAVAALSTASAELVQGDPPKPDPHAQAPDFGRIALNLEEKKP